MRLPRRRLNRPHFGGSDTQIVTPRWGSQIPGDSAGVKQRPESVSFVGVHAWAAVMGISGVWSVPSSRTNGNVVANSSEPFGG